MNCRNCIWGDACVENDFSGCEFYSPADDNAYLEINIERKSFMEDWEQYSREYL